MIDEFETMTCGQRSAVRGSADDFVGGINFLHANFNGALVVFKDFLQLACLLATPLRHPIKPLCIAPGIVVDLEFVVAANRKPAGLVRLKMPVRQLKAMIPQRIFTALQLRIVFP